MDNFHFVSEIISDELSTTLAHYRRMISDAPQHCRNTIKNGPDYPHRVAVCSYIKKISLVQHLLGILRNFSKNPRYQKNANTMIVKYKLKLNQLKQKLIETRKTLNKRLNTVPIALSSKPSPERYNPRAELKGTV